MRSIEEILGWHEDWPDGSSTFKVWFDQDGNKRQHDPRPTIEERLAWLSSHHYCYEINKSNFTDWVVTVWFVGEPRDSLFSSDLSRLLDDTLRVLDLKRGSK